MNRLSVTFIPLLGSFLLLPSAIAFSPQFSNGYSAPVLVAQRLSLSQLRQLAQQITVQVSSGKQRGSGVLIAQAGQTYTVVTNAHVITATGAASIQTADGKIYPATVKQTGSSLQGNDLAVLQFQSSQQYRVVVLAPTSKMSENQPVYASGFAYDSPALVFSAGKITLLSPKPLLGGYQIGYSNQIKQGMSGGPLLNAQGELIGINGLMPQAILNDAYFYQDGSAPSGQLLPRLRANSFAVPIATLAQVAPQLAVTPPAPKSSALTPAQPAPSGLVGKIDQIAGEITVRIDSKTNGNGSGVTIAHQGQTYYVLTAFHVVKNSDEYTVVTPDGEKHPVADKDIVKANGLDVAILKFTSSRSYQVATLARYSLSDTETHWLFLSGFPGLSAGKRKLTFGFRFSREQSFLVIKDTVANLSNGYELLYTNLSLPGMSGGPLLDTQGRVIGIGGRQEGEPYNQKFDRDLGYALGVPISTGLGLATTNGIKLQWMKLETTSPPNLSLVQVSSLSQQLASTVEKPGPNADENEWLNYGSQLWRLFRPKEAVEALGQAIKLNPDFYQAYYVLGLVQESQGQYQEAVATFKQVTQLHPNYYQAWREQSTSLTVLKQYPQALEAINRAIQSNREQAVSSSTSKDFILYTDKADILKELKRYSEAEAVLTEAIKIKFNVLTYNKRGIIRKELKNYSGAIADFNQAIAIAPQYARPYYNRGALHKELENYQEAVADFTQAIAIEPQEALAYYDRGVVYILLKNYQGAIADFNQAIALNPELAQAYHGRGFIYTQLKNYSSAQADLTKAIALNPEFAQAYHRRGIVRYLQGDKPGAEADLTQAIAVKPNNAEAYYGRGLLRTELKNYSGAVADYTQAIALNPQSADAYYNRGNLRYLQGDLQGAIADFNSAIRINPNSVTALAAHTNVGLINYETGDVEGAMSQWQAAIAIDSKVAEPHLALAVALYTKGERELGLKLAAEALRLDKRLANSQFLKDNHWGDRLIANTQELLKNPQIQALVSAIH